MPELVNCPHCDKKLKVPDALVGKLVKCPTCGKTFTAKAAAPAPPPVEEKPKVRPSAVSPRRPPDEEEEEERPRRRRPRDEEDEEEEEDRPRRRRPRDDEDEEEEERPRRRRRGGYAPHRGGLILAFAIIGWLVCGIFLPIAWVMGNTDLKEMDAGRMDPEGRGLTQAGRILGMIGTILMIVGLVFACIVWGLLGLAATTR